MSIPMSPAMVKMIGRKSQTALAGLLIGAWLAIHYPDAMKEILNDWVSLLVAVIFGASSTVQSVGNTKATSELRNRRATDQRVTGG